MSSRFGFGRKIIAAGCLVLFGLFLAGDATAAPLRGRLIILTSFPEPLFEEYRRAFNAKHPDLHIHFLSRKTSAAISYIQDKSSQQVDLVWASAPDAFEVLKRSGHLQRGAQASNDGARKVLGYPIDDPDGYYTGFAISGYGIMWNKRYLAEHGLPEPKAWEDLTKPEFAGHVAITAPSRSGTTHLIAEIILQSKGWEDGWALLLKMSGNLATLTARSFGVRDGILAARFGLGPVIDFFGLSSIASGKTVGFIYPTETVLLPANIALVEGAQNAKAAQAFIDFLKSYEGQRLLFDPNISRLPVHPDVYDHAPAGFPYPFNGSIETSGLVFDSDLSRRRYHLVNSLYDQLVTYQLKSIQSAWRSLRNASESLSASPDPELAKQLRQAEQLLTRVPVSGEQSRDLAFAGQFSRRKPGFAVSDHQSEMEQKWLSDAKARYAKAKSIADDVLEMLESRHSVSP